MFSTFRTTAIGAAALALAQFTSPAQAAFIFTMEQVGSDVVVNGSGSLNTSDFVLGETGGPSGLQANPAMLVVEGGTVDFFQSFSGPANFGPGRPFIPFPRPR